MFESDKDIQLILIATGTEVGITLDAAKQLDAQGVGVRMVSMPCAEEFMRQEKAFRESIFPSNIRARLAVEAGVSDYWRKFVGLDGDVVGVDRFGASAPGSVLMEHFGFTVENIIQRARALL